MAAGGLSEKKTNCAACVCVPVDELESLEGFILLASSLARRPGRTSRLVCTKAFENSSAQSLRMCFKFCFLFTKAFCSLKK